MFLIPHCNQPLGNYHLSFGIATKINMHYYLKRLLKYSHFQQPIYVSQIFFIYFNQNNVL